MEQVGEAREQRLLAPALVLGLVVQHFIAEGTAEVEGLQHRVRVAGVAELQGELVTRTGWGQEMCDSR